MGFHVKPWTVVGIISIAVCILICIGIAAYHLKSITPTHYGDPHHVTTGTLKDMTNHSSYEKSNPHGLDNLDVVVVPEVTINTTYPHILRPETTPLTTVDNTTSIFSGCGTHEWECNIRLDEDVLPLHYDLYLNPETAQGLYNGRVAIVLNITRTVDHIRVHSKNLNITSYILYEGNSKIEIQEMLVYARNEFLVFRPMNLLIPNQYKLIIDFRGNLTKGIVGLYRSEYFDPVKNETKYVISSKFQPTYARRAFPCMDEPGFKSTFNLSIVRPNDMVALSNMPILEEQKDKPMKGVTTVQFEKSLPMVTYLVAVAVGDFDFKSAQTNHNVTIRVYATRFQVDKTQYAMDIVPRMVEFYENYFDIKYPLPKMDIIGIPDFVSGAMEHWGMISFREANLLYQNGVSSAANKQRIASVLAHEIAHMWFGNLMTLKWWSDLWLNEGFASYCEYKAVNHVHPDWEIESQFVSQDLTPVLVLDGQLSSHPIVQKVSNPDQITEIFDSISYNKGSSVIRMLENLISPAKFQHGVRKFLKTFSYKNAETSDLWVALQSEVGQRVNISLVMDTWTRQMGYPVLHTEMGNGQLTIRQERFMENRKHDYNASDSPFGYKWEIPIQMIQEDDNKTLQKIVMHHGEDSVSILLPRKQPKWMKLNVGYFGFFRVKYSDIVWRQIQAFFRTSFTPKERCALVDDIFSLAYSQYLTYDLALEFAQALRKDWHLIPWDCADRHLFQISSLLENSAPETYVLFRKYIQNITSTLYGKFNWTDVEGEKHLDRLLKVKIFSLACSHGHSGCLETTKNFFTNWIEKNLSVPAGLRPVVYKWGMWQSNEDVWDKVWSRYLKESDSQERIRLLSSLAWSQQAWVLRRFIKLASNELFVRQQDFFTTMRFIAENSIGNPIAWTNYRNKYEELRERFSINDRYFGRMIQDLTGSYTSEIRLQEMESFFKLYPNAGAGKRARGIALERVQNNINWTERNVPVIQDWLHRNFS